MQKTPDPDETTPAPGDPRQTTTKRGGAGPLDQYRDPNGNYRKDPLMPQPSDVVGHQAILKRLDKFIGTAQREKHEYA